MLRHLPARAAPPSAAAPRASSAHPQPAHLQRLPSTRRSVVRRATPHPEVPDDTPSSSSSPSPSPAPSPSSSSSSPSSSVIPDSLPAISSETDWREFRARLVARNRAPAAPTPTSTPAAPAAPTATPASSPDWAHGLPNPERGCLLLSHPYMFTTTQTYFHRAVILIIDHDDKAASWGLILNRPTQYKIGDVETLATLCPEFSGNPIFLGGDVGGAHKLHLLHQVPGLPDSKEVVSGVFYGGVQGAKQTVSAGKHQPEDFRWFASYAGWGAGQLAQECKKGTWFVAAASPSVALAGMSSPRAPELAWHRVLELMGGQYAELSANVRASEEGRPPAGAAAVERQRQQQQQQQEREGKSEGRGAVEEGEGGATQ